MAVTENAKSVRKQMSKRIRNILNETFDAELQWKGSLHPDERDTFCENVIARKSEVFAYINGLLKQSAG